MSVNSIPENVRWFILKYIDSVEQLHVLFLLFSDPERVWGIEEITAELRSATGSIEKRLEDLYDRKVLVQNRAKPDQHQFSLYSVGLRPIIKEVSDYFELCPYRIIELIYSRSNENLRIFSDAFRIKKDRN